MAVTSEALVIFLAFVVPGAFYEWAYERQTGRWNDAATDRLIRFVASASVFHALAFPMSFAVWRDYVRDWDSGAGGSTPWLLWLFLWAAVVVPSLLGGLVGRGTRAAKRWVQPLTGRDPAPRAWDHLFSRRGAAWIRLKLKSGPWVAGKFVTDTDDRALRSYAGGYPSPADLYLLHRVEVDPDSGAWKYDGDGQIALRESGLLLRWDEVEFLEYFPED